MAHFYRLPDLKPVDDQTRKFTVNKGDAVEIGLWDPVGNLNIEAKNGPRLLALAPGKRNGDCREYKLLGMATGTMIVKAVTDKGIEGALSLEISVRDTIALWASTDVASQVCDDARLHEKGGSAILDKDTTYGQAGWEVGINFGDLHDLATKVAQKQKLIRKMAINAHGYPGEFYINSKKGTPLKGDNVTAVHNIDLTTVRQWLTPNATLLLVGCLAGKGLGGTALVEKLSDFLKGRTVVAFSTVGYIGSLQIRNAASRDWDQGVCTEPGARYTDEFINSGSEQEEIDRYFKNGKWENLSALPWASENSPHAKLAMNGKVIRGQEL